MKWQQWGKRLMTVLAAASLLSLTALAAPGEDTEQEKTLEELRDEWITLLEPGEQTEALQQEINRIIALEDPEENLRAYLEKQIELLQMEAQDPNLGGLGAFSPPLSKEQKPDAEEAGQEEQGKQEEETEEEPKAEPDAGQDTAGKEEPAAEPAAGSAKEEPDTEQSAAPGQQPDTVQQPQQTPVQMPVTESGPDAEAAEPEPEPPELLIQAGEIFGEEDARLLELTGYDGGEELTALIENAMRYLEPSGPDVAAIVMLNDLVEQGYLTGLPADEAAHCMHLHRNKLLPDWQIISQPWYTRMEAASLRIAVQANKAQPFFPLFLVCVGKKPVISHPMFTYDGVIMVSMQDASSFLNANLIRMEENDTIILQSSDMVLEMTQGSGDAYLNDKALNLEVPVLTFDGICYLPLNTVAYCGGMEQRMIGNYYVMFNRPE